MMATKFLKPAAALAFGAVLLGFFLFGTDFFSYMRTSTRAVQSAVKENISVEFELQRARDMVDDILPRLQANVRMIAEDEVEIASLEKDIEGSQKRLEDDREKLTDLRAKLDIQQVAYRIGKREITREHLAEQLAQAFSRYREAELTLSSKEQLLATRRKSLEAGMQMLERAKHQKLQLEQKIESLVAQHRLVKASAGATSTAMEEADFSRAEKLVGQIENRLDVAQRIVAHESELTEIRVMDEGIDESEVLAEFDDYFQPENATAEEFAANEL